MRLVQVALMFKSGEYDIEIDANQNGNYDAATDGLDSGSPSFVEIADAQPPNRNHRSDRLAMCYRDVHDWKRVQLTSPSFFIEPLQACITRA